MITILDIIDTTVKIGLGALISGVTTYYVSARMHAHERNHELILYKRNKLIEISEKIQLAGELTNQITHQAIHSPENSELIIDQGISSALENAKDICNLVSSALRLSALINDQELVKLLKAYWENRNSFYKIILENQLDSWNEYNTLKSQATELRLNIYNHFSTALDKIYA